MAAAIRRTILAAASDSSSTVAFTEAVKNAESGGKENGSLKEVYEPLTRKQREQMWSDLAVSLDAASELIDSYATTSDTESSPPVEVEQAINLISATGDMLLAALSIKNPGAVSTSMLHAACVVHDQLFSLGVTKTKVREKIARMCETWWKLGLIGKEQLVPQTISYLLMRAMQPEMHKTDVKRVYNFRESLLIIDLADPSADLLKGALLQCAVSPSFLDIQEGQKFVSYLFCLNLAWVQQLHNAVRSTLAVCPSAYLRVYADVYFKAWRAATGPYLEQIERYCIQDIMDRAVHAQRIGNAGGLAGRLRKILDAFHDRKKERGVDEMLTRLYQPILWRALKASNPLVRANAASLFFSAFPLYDPNASRADEEEFTQKQFDAMSALLVDEYPVVRLVAVQGICRVVGVYWELIPKTTLTAFLGKLVGNLACDATSAAVRAAVFKGLDFLLDNHLCRPILKELLPQMSEMIHDPSERVRRAFFAMLLTIKKIRGIRFWDVVPLDHLLGRLEVETDTNAAIIVELLQSSYFPVDKAESVRISRCLQMAQEWPRAARKFFRHLANVVPENVAGKFIVNVLDTIADKGSTTSTDVEVDNLLEDFDDDDTVPEGNDATDTIDECDSASLLEGCALLLGSLSTVLLSKENKAFCERLKVSINDAVEVVEKQYGASSRSALAMEQIQCYIPASSGQMKTASAELKRMNSTTPTVLVEALVDRLCAWDKHDVVMSQSRQWILDVFDPSATGTKMSKTRTKNKRSKKAANDDSDPRKIDLAFDCLDRAMMSANFHAGHITERKVNDVIKTLSMAMSTVNNRLEGDDTISDVTTAQIVRALEMQFKLSLLLLKNTKCGLEAIMTLCVDRIGWAQTVLLPAWSTNTTAVHQKSTLKRKTSDSVTEKSTTVDVSPFIVCILVTIAEALKIGAMSNEFQSTIEGFLSHLFDTDTNSTHSAAIGKLLCELIACNGDTMKVALRFIPAWLNAAGHSMQSLAAVRPIVTTIGKVMQRRRQYLQFVSAIGEACAQLDADDKKEAVAYLASYLTTTTIALESFISSLSTDDDSLEANLHLLTTITDSVMNTVTDESSQSCNLEPIHSYAKSVISKIDSLEAERTQEKEKSAVVEPQDMPTESAAQKRKRQLALSAVSLKLNEAKLNLETLVEQQQFTEAAEIQESIKELEEQKMALQPPAAQIASSTATEPEPPLMVTARAAAEYLLTTASA